MERAAEYAVKVVHGYSHQHEKSTAHSCTPHSALSSSTRLSRPKASLHTTFTTTHHRSSDHSPTIKKCYLLYIFCVLLRQTLQENSCQLIQFIQQFVDRLRLHWLIFLIDLNQATNQVFLTRQRPRQR